MPRKRKSIRSKSAQRKATRSALRNKSISNKSELEQIEELLGEEFESLSEARKAFKKETGVAPNKSEYTVKELSSRSHKTIKTFIPDLEEHAEEINALKDQGDFWAAEIYGYKTYSVFGNIQLLANKLAQYRGLQEEHPQAALRNIKVLRVKGLDADKFLAAKKKQVQESWEKRTKQKRIDRKRTRQQKQKIKMLEKQLLLERKARKAAERKLKNK